MRFGEAKERLEEILQGLESHEVDIDDLAARVREAAALIRVLNDKLTKTRTEVERVVADVRRSAPDAPTAAPCENPSAGPGEEPADDVPF